MTIPRRRTTSKTHERKTHERTEEIEQARLIKWSHKREVRELMPALRWLHHSPNGGERSAFAGAQMKALGVKKGFPDLVLPVKSSVDALTDRMGLVIEMKSATGRLSAEQAEWFDHFSAQGWSTIVCRSAEEAREALCVYLGVRLVEAPSLDPAGA